MARKKEVNTENNVKKEEVSNAEVEQDFNANTEIEVGSTGKSAAKISFEAFPDVGMLPPDEVHEESEGSGFLPETIYSASAHADVSAWKAFDASDRETEAIFESIRRVNVEKNLDAELIIDSKFSNEDIRRKTKMIVPMMSASSGMRLTHHRFVTFMERNDLPIWSTIRLTPASGVDVLENLLSYLEYYPKVVDELLEWFRNSDIEHTLIMNIVEPRIRFGREAYREGNFKLATSELIRAISNRYSSWKKDQGRELLVAILVQLISADLAKTHWLKHDMDYLLPMRNIPLDNIKPGLNSIKHTAFKKILSNYFVLSQKLSENGASGADNLFKVGTAMLKTDLMQAIRTTKKAVAALVFNAERLETSYAIAEALALIKVYNLKTVNYDKYSSILEHSDLIKLCDCFDFVYPILDSVAAFEEAALLDITAEEAAIHVTRVAELWFSSPNYKISLISDVKDRVTFIKTYKNEGERVGGVMITTNESKGPSLFFAAKARSSVADGSLFNYETLSYRNSTSNFDSLHQKIASIGSLASFQKYIQESDLASLPLDGLTTNLHRYEQLLYYLSLNDGELTLDHDTTSGEDLLKTLVTVSGMIVRPSIVFPLSLSYKQNNKWFKNRVADETYYLRDLTAWFLGSELEDRIAKKPWRTYEIGIPRVGLLDETYKSLESILRCEGEFYIHVNYEYNGKKYITDMHSDHAVSDESLAGSYLYQDEIPYQITNYNLELLFNLHKQAIVCHAVALKESADQPKFQYSYQNMLIDNISGVFKELPFFRKILSRLVHSVLTQMALDEQVSIRALQGSVVKKVTNDLGIVLADNFNARYSVLHPKIFNEFKRACAEQGTLRMLNLWL